MNKCVRVVFYDFENHATARASHVPGGGWVFHEPWMKGDESLWNCQVLSRATTLLEKHCLDHKAFIDSCALAVSDEVIEKKVYAIAPGMKAHFKLYEVKVYSPDVEQDGSSQTKYSGEIECWLEAETGDDDYE